MTTSPEGCFCRTEMSVHCYGYFGVSVGGDDKANQMLGLDLIVTHMDLIILLAHRPIEWSVLMLP